MRPGSKIIKNSLSLARFHGSLSSHVLTCISQAVFDVQPSNLMRSSLKVTSNSLCVTDIWGVTQRFALPRRFFVVGAGKAASEMYSMVYTLLGNSIEDAAITVPHLTGDPYPGPVRVTKAGHPIPTNSGMRGTKRIIETLSMAQKGDIVMILLSGGASALMPLPATGISLAEKQQITRLLLSSGASIREINIVRKHLSAVKGGRLASYVTQSVPIISLIISDVIGDRIEDIGSGPTAPDPSTFLDADNILKKFNITMSKVQKRFQLGIRKKIPETPKPGDKVFSRVSNVIIGANTIAVESAINCLRTSGIKKIYRFKICGEASDLGRSVARRSRTLNPSRNQTIAMVGGGETTVTLSSGFGATRGGRNQEAALAFCLKAGPSFGGVGAFVGTDGRDGNSPAAGAIVSAKTLEQAKKHSINLNELLESHRSYEALLRTKSTVLTGLTGTNVNDLAIILIPPAPQRPKRQEIERIFK